MARRSDPEIVPPAHHDLPQSMEIDILCPGCNSQFSSLDALTRHLNTPGITCVSTLESSYQIPTPPSLRRGAGETNITSEYHEHSGSVYGKGETLLDRLMKDEHEKRREHNIYYPFQDEGEWELAKFLASNLTKAQVSQFLQLPWFNTRSRPSFKNTDQLFGWISQLPSGAQWRVTTVRFRGYETQGRQEIRLMWRDGMEVVRDIFSNPIFANHMTYDPHKIMCGAEREYSEFFTGMRAFEIQDMIEAGGTIVPIILASDKTPVTRQTGGLEMHPVFVTIGNIQSDVRMQATSHAWRCVAFIPTPAFKVHSDFRSILLARLFHWSLDAVTVQLKAAAQNGCTLVDPSGHIRKCYTPLVSYIADLPEQQVIAGVARNASSVTTAVVSQFGDATLAPPRTRQGTLSQLRDLCQQTDPWDIVAFQKAAKAINLIGVHKPFWRNWKYAEPSLFLTGEILHATHKFFFDHPLNWCKTISGAHTLDTRFSNLHKRVSLRHFSTGVSHRLQMTGRDHRDMERSIVPILDGAGAASDEFIAAIRAMVEFIYRAQDPVYTDSSIALMERALADFHARKSVILRLGARKGSKGPMDHFKIPKLEVLQSFARQTKANGALIQYTADVTERLLITHCKTPFQRTSRQSRTYVDQVVAILDREETLRLFDLYIILRLAKQSAMDTVVHQEYTDITLVDPTLEFIQHVLPENESTFRGPRPFRNHFADRNSIVSLDGDVALHVTIQPDRTSLSVAGMQTDYKLPDLSFVIARYIHEASQGHPSKWDIGGNVSTWHKFRLQLHSSFRSRYIDKSQVIQAFPPSSAYPLGNCDAVLLRRAGTDDRVVYDVAQVRAVFMPRSAEDLPHYLAVPLCYVRFFHILPLSRPCVGLYQVERMHPLDGPTSGIVPLTEVVRPIDLVPVFDTAFADIPPSSNTCMEGYARYYLNTFADKDTFHALSSQVL